MVAVLYGGDPKLWYAGLLILVILFGVAAFVGKDIAAYFKREE